MFELVQIRCFNAVADDLHFGRAALRLNMTQPSVSRQVQLLERIMGVTLLDRTSRSVRLTPAGRIFLAEAKQILRLADAAVQTTRNVASGDIGRIAVGFTASCGYSFLPHLIELARDQLPKIDLTLRELVSSEQSEAVLTGQINIGLMRPPVSRPEFDSLRVSQEPLVAALPTGDPRLEKRRLTLADFEGLPFIMYAPEGAGYFHDLLCRLLQETNVTPRYAQHLTQVHSILALVRAQVGAAAVPEAATRLRLDGVEFRPLDTAPVRPIELFAAWRRDDDNPSLFPFLDLIRAQSFEPTNEVV